MGVGSSCMYLVDRVTPDLTLAVVRQRSLGANVVVVGWILRAIWKGDDQPLALLGCGRVPCRTALCYIDPSSASVAAVRYGEHWAQQTSHTFCPGRPHRSREQRLSADLRNLVEAQCLVFMTPALE